MVMLTCQVCGEDGFKRLSSHLRTHNMTTEEYREKFDAPTTSEETSRMISENTDYSDHSERMEKLANEGVVLPEEKIDREAIGERQRELWQDEEYRQNQKEAGNAFLSEEAWNEGMTREQLVEKMGEARYKE